MTEIELQEHGIFPHGPRWNDAEIATLLRRTARLRKGLEINDLESEQLAERMLYRDRPGSGDDRRICLECRQFKGGSIQACQVGILVPRTIMQRCDQFEVRG